MAERHEYAGVGTVPGALGGGALGGGALGLVFGVFVLPSMVIPFLEPAPHGFEAMAALMFTVPIGLILGIWAGVRIGRHIERTRID